MKIFDDCKMSSNGCADKCPFDISGTLSDGIPYQQKMISRTGQTKDSIESISTIAVVGIEDIILDQTGDFGKVSIQRGSCER